MYLCVYIYRYTIQYIPLRIQDTRRCKRIQIRLFQTVFVGLKETRIICHIVHPMGDSAEMSPIYPQVGRCHLSTGCTLLLALQKSHVFTNFSTEKVNLTIDHHGSFNQICKKISWKIRFFFSTESVEITWYTEWQHSLTSHPQHLGGHARLACSLALPGASVVPEKAGEKP